MLRSILILSLFVPALVLAACSNASDESEAKRSPIPPPPPEVDVPSSLHIPVQVDGEEAEPITARHLESLEPDYSDEDRRAWRLTRVLGEPFRRPSAVVEAVGPENVSVSMHSPDTEGEPQPVLYLTRRGDVVVAVVDPNRPFPDYHGQGGRLRRPGDPRPRLSSVERLRVSVPSTASTSE